MTKPKTDAKKGLEEIPSQILRILDANLNRLREGMRVVEDIRRYYFDDQKNSLDLKELRHKARLEPYALLLQSRDIQNDVSKSTTQSEISRKDLNSLQLANLKRAQESARVLEETLKLFDIQEAQNFKNMRYALYQIEINILTK